MRGKGSEAGSVLPGGPHLPRPPARGDQPVLREGPEPHAGGGHYGTQDVADAEKVHPPEGGRFGGVVEVKPETYTELGKACLNIAVGLFLVGIVQPILSGKAILAMEGISWGLFLFFGTAGVILLNKGGLKNDDQS